MAKISTLAGIFLVLWLAMSVGTWAGRPPTEELGAWVEVLEGAETALRHDKLQTAMAMIAGVAARLDAIDMSEDEKAKHFKDLLGGIEEAVEADNKVKAVAIMNAIREEFQERHGNARPGAVPQRQLHEHHHHHHHHDQFQDHYAAQYPNPDAVQAVKSRLKEAFYAIAHDQKEKAENILHGFYHLINENKDLCSKEKATLFLHAIHQTEALLTKHATQQAEQEITQAAKTLGYSVLGEGRTF